MEKKSETRLNFHPKNMPNAAVSFTSPNPKASFTINEIKKYTDEEVKNPMIRSEIGILRINEQITDKISTRRMQPSGISIVILSITATANKTDKSKNKEIADKIFKSSNIRIISLSNPPHA